MLDKAMTEEKVGNSHTERIISSSPIKFHGMYRNRKSICFACVKKRYLTPLIFSFRLIILSLNLFLRLMRLEDVDIPNPTRIRVFLAVQFVN